MRREFYKNGPPNSPFCVLVALLLLIAAMALDLTRPQTSASVPAIGEKRDVIMMGMIAFAGTVVYPNRKPPVYHRKQMWSPLASSSTSLQRHAR